MGTNLPLFLFDTNVLGFLDDAYMWLLEIACCIRYPRKLKVKCIDDFILDNYLIKHGFHVELHTIHKFIKSHNIHMISRFQHMCNSLCNIAAFQTGDKLVMTTVMPDVAINFEIIGISYNHIHLLKPSHRIPYKVANTTWMNVYDYYINNGAIVTDEFIIEVLHSCNIKLLLHMISNGVELLPDMIILFYKTFVHCNIHTNMYPIITMINVLVSLGCKIPNRSPKYVEILIYLVHTYGLVLSKEIYVDAMTCNPKHHEIINYYNSHMYI